MRGRGRTRRRSRSPMADPRFKLGDRVQTSNDSLPARMRGRCGTVMVSKHLGDGGFEYQVNFVDILETCILWYAENLLTQITAPEEAPKP